MTAGDGLEARLRAFEDTQEILALLYRYTHGVDGRRDLREVFAEDASLTTLGPDGEVLHSSRGVEQIEARMRSRNQPPPFALAPIVEVDGDAARAESYFVALNTGYGGLDVHVYGRYSDVFVRRGGRWLLQERTARTEAIRARE